jgi:hypothetical protein
MLPLDPLGRGEDQGSCGGIMKTLVMALVLFLVFLGIASRMKSESA